MKRLSTFNKDLAELEKSREKLQKKIDSARSKLLKKEEKDVRKEQKRFIHNVQLSRLPVMRREAPITIANENEPSTIFDCFYIHEMANQVLKHMGPYELYICSRVSHAFAQTVASSFVSLAPFYLQRYGEDIKNSDARAGEIIDNANYEIDNMVVYSILTAAIEKPGIVSLGSLLSLWAKFFRKYRRYYIDEGHGPGDLFHVDYSFYEERHADKSARYIRLCDTNAFITYKFPEVKYKMIARRQEEFPFDATPSLCPIDHFNYNELCALEMEPLYGYFDPTYIVFINGDKLQRFGSKETMPMRGIKPPTKGGVVINSSPFIDLYELSLPLKTPLVRISPHEKTIEEHIRQISDALSM